MIDLPRTSADWASIWRTIRRALATPGMLPLALIVAILLATVSAIARRLPFVAAVLLGDLPIWLRVEFLLLYLPVIGGLPASLADVAGLVVAIVAAVTVVVLLADVLASDDETATPGREPALVLGALAVLCAVLGPALLAGVAGLAGANGLLASLPLGGLEVSLLAVPGMILAIFWIGGGQVASADGSP